MNDLIRFCIENIAKYNDRYKMHVFMGADLFDEICRVGNCNGDAHQRLMRTLLCGRDDVVLLDKSDLYGVKR